ncbi:hypothetical protein BH160DRAFT_3830 [Burkholderia sp. H160]|nr:hypothetical protein BH160DRAFT_3830 [Burkholderia sp. H160]
MLADVQLRALKPAEKIYKVADQRGLYVAVMPSGAASFRYDYRINGLLETLVIGRSDPSLSARKPRKPDELGFGRRNTLPTPPLRIPCDRVHRRDMGRGGLRDGNLDHSQGAHEG